MLKPVFCVSLALGAATLVGCKDDETKTPAPAAVTPPATMPAASDAATPPATQPTAEVPAVPPAPTVPAVTPPTAPAVTPPAAPAVTAPAAPEVTAPTADAVDPEAKGLMDQAEDAIKNKKWDDASAALKKLEAMKDKLPQSWQDKLKSLETAVDAGKLSSSIPGFGK